MYGHLYSLTLLLKDLKANTQKDHETSNFSPRTVCGSARSHQRCQLVATDRVSAICLILDSKTAGFCLSLLDCLPQLSYHVQMMLEHLKKILFCHM